MLSSLSSLRVRLPLLFLAGIVLAGARHGPDRDPALPRLRAQPDAERAAARVGERSRSCTRAGSRPTSPRAAASRAGRRRSRARSSRRRPATGSTSTGPSARSPARTPGCRGSTCRRSTGRRANTLTFVFTPPHLDGAYYAVANPVQVGTDDDRRDRRREAEDRDQPVRRLARAAARDRVGVRAARGGRVRLVRLAAARRSAALALAGDRRGRGRELRRRAAARRAPGRDRPPGGAVRRDDHAPPGVGGARAELPDDGLARAAHAAHRDPRPRLGARRGARRGPEAARRSRSSPPRRSGSSASSATSSTWPGSTRTGSPCCARRSGWSTSSSAPTRPSPSRPGRGRSTSR